MCRTTVSQNINLDCVNLRQILFSPNVRRCHIDTGSSCGGISHKQVGDSLDRPVQATEGSSPMWILSPRKLPYL